MPTIKILTQFKCEYCGRFMSNNCGHYSLLFQRKCIATDEGSCSPIEVTRYFKTNHKYLKKIKVKVTND